MTGAEELRVYRDLVGGGYRWVLRSGSGERLAESEGAIREREGCLAQARALLSERPSATLRDLTRPPGTGP